MAAAAAGLVAAEAEQQEAAEATADAARVAAEAEQQEAAEATADAARVAALALLARQVVLPASELTDITDLPAILLQYAAELRLRGRGLIDCGNGPEMGDCGFRCWARAALALGIRKISDPSSAGKAMRKVLKDRLGLAAVRDLPVGPPDRNGEQLTIGGQCVLSMHANSMCKPKERTPLKFVEEMQKDECYMEWVAVQALCDALHVYVEVLLVSVGGRTTSLFVPRDWKLRPLRGTIRLVCLPDYHFLLEVGIGPDEHPQAAGPQQEPPPPEAVLDAPAVAAACAAALAVVAAPAHPAAAAEVQAAAAAASLSKAGADLRTCELPEHAAAYAVVAAAADADGRPLLRRWEKEGQPNWYDKPVPQGSWVQLEGLLQLWDVNTVSTAGAGDCFILAYLYGNGGLTAAQVSAPGPDVQQVMDLARNQTVDLLTAQTNGIVDYRPEDGAAVTLPVWRLWVTQQWEREYIGESDGAVAARW